MAGAVACDTYMWHGDTWQELWHGDTWQTWSIRYALVVTERRLLSDGLVSCTGLPPVQSEPHCSVSCSPLHC